MPAQQERESVGCSCACNLLDHDEIILHFGSAVARALECCDQRRPARCCKGVRFFFGGSGCLFIRGLLLAGFPTRLQTRYQLLGVFVLRKKSAVAFTVLAQSSPPAQQWRHPLPRSLAGGTLPAPVDSATDAHCTWRKQGLHQQKHKRTFAGWKQGKRTFAGCCIVAGATAQKRSLGSARDYHPHHRPRDVSKAPAALWLLCPFRAAAP